MNNQGWKRMLTGLCVLVLLLTGCLPALASTGDKTLQRTVYRDGMSSDYIVSVQVISDGIYLLLQSGQDLKIRRYANAAAAPEEFIIPGMFGYQYVPVADDRMSLTQTMGWFAWNDEIYAFQYDSVSSGEEQDVENACFRKLTEKDGQMTLEDSDLPEPDVSDLMDEYGENRSLRWMNDFVVSGNRLVSVSYDQNGESALVSMDLTTGMTTEIGVYNVNQLIPDREGSVLMTRYDWTEKDTVVRLNRMDLDSQSEEELLAVPVNSGTLQGLCYDSDEDKTIYVLDGQLYVASGMDIENAEAVNDGLPGYDLTIKRLPEGFVLLWNQNLAVIRNTDPAQRAAIALTVTDLCGAESFENAMFDLGSERGDISVTLRRTGDENAVLQAMMNRDPSVDIYAMIYSGSAFDALRNRGFMGDMSGNQVLAEAVTRMYPFMQEAVQQDGKLICVPVSLYGYCPGYREEEWKKLGLTEADVPQTWDAFFDLLEKLPELVEGKDVAIFEQIYTRAGFRSDLRNILLNQYQAYLNRGETEYAFNTPLLNHLLARLDALDYDALGLQEVDSEELIHYADYSGEYKPPVLELYTSATMNRWTGDAKPLTLRLEEGQDPILPLTAGMAFVNPCSEHPEEAAEFLAFAVADLSDETQYNIFSDRTEPIRYPDFEETKENLRQWLDQMKEQLETADEENREALEGSIREMEDSLANFDNSYWSISPEGIADYQKRVGWLEVLSYDFTSSLVTDGGDAYDDMLNRYALGQVSAEEMLNWIDKKVQMMRLEGN